MVDRHHELIPSTSVIEPRQKRLLGSFSGCFAPLAPPLLSLASRRLRSASLSSSSLEDTWAFFAFFGGLTGEESDSSAAELRRLPLGFDAALAASFDDACRESVSLFA